MSKVHLGDVAKECRETCKDDTSQYPLVGLEHLDPCCITLSRWDEAGKTEDSTFSKRFFKNQILFGRRRAYLKKAVVAPFDGICSGDITVIEAIPGKIVPELLPFIIQNDRFFDYAVEKSAGSLSPRVKWEHLKEYEFDLPDIEEQKRLAEILWAAEDLKLKYQLSLTKLEKYADLIFNSMIGCSNFPTCKLSEECKLITKGTTPTTLGFQYTKSGINFVKVENLTPEGKITSELMHIDNKCNDTMKRSQLEVGDVLFSIAGAIGRCSVVSKEILPANTNQAVSIIRLKEDTNISAEFLVAVLQSSFIQEQATNKACGTSQLNISLNDVANFIIPIPSKIVQSNYISMTERLNDMKKLVHIVQQNVCLLINSHINQLE